MVKRSFRRGPVGSSRKQLHPVYFTATIDPAATPIGTVLGYIDVFPNLSNVLGRNMSQSQVARLVAVDMNLSDQGVAENASKRGYAAVILSAYATPSSARVSAHERILREMASEEADTQLWSRNRQLIVKYDRDMPNASYIQALMRQGANPLFPMLFSTGTGTAGISIFEEYNGANPRMVAESIVAEGAVASTSQELFAGRASSVQDLISSPVALSSYQNIAHDWEYASASGTTTPPPNEFALALSSGVNVHSPHRWEVPSGTYVPIMCGLMKVTMASNMYSGPGLGVDGVTAEPRATFNLSATYWFEGWHPLKRAGR